MDAPTNETESTQDTATKKALSLSTPWPSCSAASRSLCWPTYRATISVLFYKGDDGETFRLLESYRKREIDCSVLGRILLCRAGMSLQATFSAPQQSV